MASDAGEVVESVRTRINGAIEARRAFAGYGERILADGSYVPLTGYTGHVQVDPTGLIYMRGRFYSPAWHSFVNSDQGVDSNSWNQAAYVAGRPFMATDPSGMRNSQPGARNSWAADWSRIFGFWLSDSYGINSAVVEVTDASPFPDYFDVGYSPPSGWGYDGSLLEVGRGGGAAPVKPQTPKEKNPCDDPVLKKYLAQIQQMFTTTFKNGSIIGNEMGGTFGNYGFNSWTNNGAGGSMSVGPNLAGTEMMFHFHPNAFFRGGRMQRGDPQPSWPNDYNVTTSTTFNPMQAPHYVFSSSGIYRFDPTNPTGGNTAPSNPNNPNRPDLIAGSNWTGVKCN